MYPHVFSRLVTFCEFFKAALKVNIKVEKHAISGQSSKFLALSFKPNPFVVCTFVRLYGSIYISKRSEDSQQLCTS